METQAMTEEEMKQARARAIRELENAITVALLTMGDIEDVRRALLTARSLVRDALGEAMT